jgi:exonuclease VII small subunit
MVGDNSVDLKLNLDFKGVNDALYQMIGQFNGTDKEFQKIAASIEKNAKSLEASIKLFGPASQQAANAQKALERNMVSLVANGVNPEKAAIATLQQNFSSLNTTMAVTESAVSKTSNTFNNSANSIKNSNKQYSALALVLQDLPYGFRGIQNNLPALFGSIATGTGIAYVAFSALVAIITALDMGLIKFGKSVKLTTDFSKESATTYSNETIKLESLYAVSTNVNASMSDRLQAAKTLKSEYPDLLALYSEEQITLGEAEIAYRLLTDTIWQYAQAKAAEKALEELAIKQIDLNTKKTKAQTDQKERQVNAFKEVKALLWDEMTFTQRLNKTLLDLPKGPLMMVNTLNAVNKSSEILYGIEEQQKAINDEVAIYKGIINENINAEDKLAKFKANEYAKEQTRLKKLGLKDNKERLKAIEDANNAEIKAFASSLDERAKKEYEAGLVLNANLEKMRAAGYKDSTTYYTAYRAEMDNIAKYYNDKELQEAQKIADKIASIQLDMRFKMQSALASINERFANEDIKNNNTRLNATLKATRGNYQAQKAAIEEAILKNEEYRQSAIEAGYGTEQFDAAAKNLQAQLEGLVDPLEEFNNSLRNILSTTFADFLAAFGQGFASMFNGGGMEEAMNNFLGILAEGLIQVGKLAIATGLAIEGIKAALKSLNPILAIAAGIALVGLGSYVKNSLSKTSNNMGSTKKFANGGIISGPTMGLMGEYPGASHNPEVVAPLDKLKSLIGGGGGSLEARISGNDLLILMNKAGRTNNNTF